MFVVLLVMAPPSQELEPPTNPGRFIPTENDSSSSTFSDSFLIANIVVDESVHPREKIHPGLVKSLRKKLKQGAQLSPIILFIDEAGIAWLADGFHRLQAYVDKGRGHVSVEIRLGSKRDATLAAIKINAHHGRKLTNKEKRAAVRTVLNDPEAYELSDSEIAEMCGCDPKTVASEWERHPVASEFRSDTCNVRSRNGDRRSMNIAQIGRRKQSASDADALLSVEVPDAAHSDRRHEDGEPAWAAGSIEGGDQEAVGLHIASEQSTDGEKRPEADHPVHAKIEEASQLVARLAELTTGLDHVLFGSVLALADQATRERFEDVVDLLLEAWNTLEDSVAARSGITVEEAADAHE